MKKGRGSRMGIGPSGAVGECVDGGQLGLVGEKTLVEVGRCQPCFSETCMFEPRVAKASPWPSATQMVSMPSPPEVWELTATPPTRHPLEVGISCFLFRLTVVCNISGTHWNH